MATTVAEYHISKDNQNANYAYAGKPGLGTVALIAPVQIDDWKVTNDVPIDPLDPTLGTNRRASSEPADGEVIQMHGLRSIRGPNIATNTISAAHHQSTGGFMINYPGLRDGGTFDFEANFNPDQIGWQDMHNDLEGYPAKSIMESPIFLHKDQADVSKSGGLPMLQMIVMPASMKHLWYMRGFIAMLGPVTYEMEDIVKATISFKISGRPFLATAQKTQPADKPAIVRTRHDEGYESVEWYNYPDTLLVPAGGTPDFYPAYWLETTA